MFTFGPSRAKNAPSQIPPSQHECSSFSVKFSKLFRRRRVKNTPSSYYFQISIRKWSSIVSRTPISNIVLVFQRLTRFASSLSTATSSTEFYFDPGFQPRPMAPVSSLATAPGFGPRHPHFPERNCSNKFQLEFYFSSFSENVIPVRRQKRTRRCVGTV